MFSFNFESDYMGLMITKHDGSIITCNDYFLKMLGFDRDDLQNGNLNWRTLTPPEYKTATAERIQTLQSVGFIAPFEKEYFHKNGERVPALVGVLRLDETTCLAFVVDNRCSVEKPSALGNEIMLRGHFMDSVLENLPIMMFVKNAKTLRFVEINRAGEELLGYSRAEILGKTDHDLFPKTEAEFFQSHDRQVLNCKNTVNICEEPVTTKSGIRYLRTKKIPITNATGDPIFILGISEDITEAKAAEQREIHLAQEQAARAEAEKSAARLKLLSEAGAALNSALDLKPRLEAFANYLTTDFADWCEVILAEDGQLNLDESVVSHHDPEMHEWAKRFRAETPPDLSKSALLAKVIYTGKPELHSVLDKSLPEQLKDPARVEAYYKVKPQSMILVPLQTFGKVNGVLVLVSAKPGREYNDLDLSLAQDLAKRASYAVENSRLVKKAEEASRAKSAFLANMSHEIRTPLGAMLGFAELIQDEALSDSQKRYLRTVLRNGHQLLAIVDEVLDLAKIESDNLKIETSSFSLSELTREVNDLLSLQAKEKRLRFQFNFPLRTPDRIVTDPMRLRQILVNVIGNAIKFTSTGGIDVNVELLPPQSPQQKKPRLEIIVTDTGIGMTAEQVERLFNPFMQADSSNSRSYGGTGLGLFLSRRLARLMGGDVELVSTQPQIGSQFKISLPVEARFELSGIKPTTEKSVASEDQGKILIVDDSADNRMLIQLYLSRLGLDSDIADSGTLAVQMTQANSYEVVLMDIQMPGMDGFEATQNLRQRGFHGRIVALTAHTMKGDRERCLSAGFDDYLGKPIDRKQLCECLEKYLPGRINALAVERFAN